MVWPTDHLFVCILRIVDHGGLVLLRFVTIRAIVLGQQQKPNSIWPKSGGWGTEPPRLLFLFLHIVGSCSGIRPSDVWHLVKFGVGLFNLQVCGHGHCHGLWCIIGQECQFDPPNDLCYC